MTPQRIKFISGSYKVSAGLHNNKIIFEAYSEMAGKMFQATIGQDDLKPADVSIFGTIETVFMMIEECIIERRKIELSDAG